MPETKAEENPCTNYNCKGYCENIECKEFPKGTGVFHCPLINEKDCSNCRCVIGCNY